MTPAKATMASSILKARPCGFAKFAATQVYFVKNKREPGNRDYLLSATANIDAATSSDTGENDPDNSARSRKPSYINATRASATKVICYKN